MLTVNVRAFDAADRFPAASVALAVSAYDPSAKAVEGVYVHWPFAPAVTVAMGVVLVPLYNEIVLLASAVPDKTGLLLLVVPEGPVKVGADGGVTSILNTSAEDATELLPAASLALAVRE